MLKPKLKQILGAILFDIPKFAYHLYISPRKHSWIYVCNRVERLITPANYLGVKCDWKWTSTLYLPSVFPLFGRLLLKNAFCDFPISFEKLLESTESERPQVSFIIGHRGMARFPLLLRTIESIASQVDCSVECIVVEQDTSSTIKELLPKWVRYHFSPIENTNQPYSRSQAFNTGADIARAECLIFHDNDILVPIHYASYVYQFYEKGFEFINLKRFIFYLNKQSTNEFLEANSPNIALSQLDEIMQNAEGGGSIGVSKKTFYEIGRFDPQFVGWGGEDNEFWERAKTRSTYAHTFLPFIHLWHPSQPNKSDTQKANDNLYWKLAKIPPEKRIERLLSVHQKGKN